MYPSDGPMKSTTSPAERRIYQLLQQKLDDNYYVFHSYPWAEPDKDGRTINGEIDFIVAHAEYGILVFEVKGGDIGYDGSTKQWISTNRYNATSNIKDAFVQGLTSAHKLGSYLKNALPSKPFAKDYWVEYAVWFPDIPWQPNAIQLPHIVDDLVLDMRACDDPESAIRTILIRNKKRRTMSPDALQALIDALAPKNVIKAKLSNKFQSEATAFIELRKDQYRKLEVLGRYPRIGVLGAAGTGKTVIALEAARRLANNGFDVLFLCSTLALARWLISMVNEEPEAIRSRITARNVEHLCRELSGYAGILL
ncbi:MAG TPA: NERD domain-containing protein/DEAD/DEAH box helicase, partial [Ktedonobacterales bacterium]|nr:NERD domain-containing protein/DEAD/DEAH box helicase [Ktedonobacterales bacterium]